jgi:hypothetical protein
MRQNNTPDLFGSGPKSLPALCSVHLDYVEKYVITV